MFQATCLNCAKTSSFETSCGTSVECPFCFEEIERSALAKPSQEVGEIVGLTLIYQINQQRLEIPSEKTVLGRESFGADVLAAILFNGKQVISRKHCSIEFRDQKFYLKDLGSLNGTYCGLDKTNCRVEQIIENQSLIYLGEEPFLALVRCRIPEAQVQPSAQTQHLRSIRKFACNDCGYETETPSSDCPECETFNSFVEILR